MKASTRRELLSGSTAVGAGMAGAGAALGALAPAGEAVARASQAEAQALIRAMQIEQLLVVAYGRVVGSPVVTATVKAQLRTHLRQEREHVGLLERVLTARGQIVPAAPSLTGAQAELYRHGIHWSLLHLRSQHDCLKLLVDVESLAENAYFRAIQKVQDATLAQTCVEVMGCEAQHWTVLSGFLNHRDAAKAAPYPFVEGTP